MDEDNSLVHPLHMGRKVKSRFKRQPQKNFIRQWRKKNNLTLERLADRVGTSHATLSRVERGLQDWDETLLRALSEALGTDYVSLLIRDPSDPEGMWSIWDQAKPAERRKIVNIAKEIMRTGT